MYSDDSAASEVASDDGDLASDGEASAVASEIEESVDRPASHRPVAAAVAAKKKPPSSDGYDDDYEDDFDEAADADEGGYSVEFENDSPQRSPVKPPLARLPSIVLEEDENGDYGEDDDYGQNSFEEESRRSQNSSRHVVNLSVPATRDSPTHRTASSPIAKAFLSSNSPNMNLKVLSKPMNMAQTSPSAGVGAGAFELTSAGAAAPVPTMVMGPVSPGMLAEGEERKFSLLLRKVESKFEDEIEELREKNALLTWKERERKSELRMHRDELQMRKSRLDKKKKRAMERRRENERMTEKLKLELTETQHKVMALNEARVRQQQDFETLQHTLRAVQDEKRSIEERNLMFAERLQTALGDFHALNLRFEQAVQDKLEAERRTEEMASKHQVALEVLEHKRQLEVDTMQRMMEQEIAKCAADRVTLPATHRLILEAEKERYEKLEAAIVKQMRELEAHVAKETCRLEKEAATAVQLKHIAEARAEERVQQELVKISRERDAVDEQRRELLVSVTRTNVRFDEERGKLDAIRAQLEVKQMKLMEERAEMDTRCSCLDERMQRLADQENVVELRKAEVARAGRETLEKTKVLAHKMANYMELQHEVETLRGVQQQMLEQTKHSEQRALELQQEKAVLEQAALKLQHERLLVAKQRVQSRQFMDGAKKLESLLQQQTAMERASQSHSYSKSAAG